MSYKDRRPPASEIHAAVRRLPPEAASALPDRTVLYLGVPYTRAKFINGFWYKEESNGNYTLFALQSRVHEIYRAAG
jgi:hypothetical protein